MKTSYRKILALLGVAKRLVGVIYPLGIKVLALLKSLKRSKSTVDKTGPMSMVWEQMPWKFNQVEWLEVNGASETMIRNTLGTRSGKILRHPIKLAPNQFDLFVDGDSQTEDELMTYYISPRSPILNGEDADMDDFAEGSSLRGVDEEGQSSPPSSLPPFP